MFLSYKREKKSQKIRKACHPLWPERFDASFILLSLLCNFSITDPRLQFHLHLSTSSYQSRKNASDFHSSTSSLLWFHLLHLWCSWEYSPTVFLHYSFDLLLSVFFSPQYLQRYSHTLSQKIFCSLSRTLAITHTTIFVVSSVRMYRHRWNKELWYGRPPKY